MTIQLYIFKQLLTSFVFSVAGIAMVVLPSVAISAVHKLGAVGLGPVLRYLPLVLLDLAPYLLPLAFLLSVVATYGRLAAERELVAIRMSAMHPARLLLPALAIATPLSLATGYSLSEVAPGWKFAQRSFTRSVDKEAFRGLARGRTELEFGDSSLVALDRSGDVFLDVLLELEGSDGEDVTVMADAVELRIEEDILALEFRNAHVLGATARVFDEFPYWSRPLDELFPPRPASRMRMKYLPSSEVLKHMRDGTLLPELKPYALFEVHKRYALAATYFLFLLLGIPTGILLRSTTQLGAITIAAAFAFVYYALALQLGQGLVKTGRVSSIPAAWATDVLYAIAGAYMSWRALWR